MKLGAVGRVQDDEEEKPALWNSAPPVLLEEACAGILIMATVAKKVASRIQLSKPRLYKGKLKIWKFKCDTLESSFVSHPEIK